MIGIEDTCPVCGKTFFHGEEWGYRVRTTEYGRVLFGRDKKFYICSYPCYCKYQSRLEIYKKTRWKCGNIQKEN